ncbi:SDR family NAD(P)-dependent oxidoreductase [Amycolatopsis thermophila]|uniref:NAD(P)-dependent dehydrogenase (Short-subunit alcohol dehydrogenase family) n=1 Tax=Amycolatopsis thermophila TaxID=206084 RepID=A0ABU0F567_9PSEU|nr:SDR family NAD(P)-dependent oxidoreductase [Amycolatopsis thermophila]MDQ0382728.1 NAD(P)-dependent dehydrogenase (short-subunit alcohol dehydrogenase family) [Amycolatopsis thermophila]
MAGRLSGRRAVVTGAASGIGRAVAERLVRDGAHVFGADVAEAGWSDSIASTAGCVTEISCDVRDSGDVAELFARVEEVAGGLDILANNAGVGGGRAYLHEYPIDDFDRVMAVNTRGAYLVLRHGLRLLLDSGGGAVVNTASIGGIIPSPKSSAYAMSKGAVVMMTKQAAVEYAGRGIRVNAVCPGTIDTPLIAEAGPRLRTILEGQIPQERLGRPEDVANLVSFLVSDESSFITGQCVVVDGGRSLL